MTNRVMVSVRQLVEYVHRSGSIDAKFRTVTTMTEGTKAHQRVQKLYNAGDQKEVSLQIKLSYEGLLFTIDGRCDGILFEEDTLVIDEIKSTNRQLELLEENEYPVHWAQAKCYAYIYASQNQQQQMTVQLRYVNLEEDEQRCFRQVWSIEDLEDFMLEMVAGFAPFAVLMKDHLTDRNESIQALPFPFKSYRAGQRQLAGSVYKTIQEGRNLFANAPTGIGKTMSTAFPAVKAIGEGHIERFFYLTAKTITRTAAEDAFSLMQSNGLQLKTVTLTAKEKICFKEKAICQKEYCEFANGYYDRLNEAMIDLLVNNHFIDRKTIEDYARKHTICPFEFSLDVAYQADAIICDYNYIFDPRVSLKRYFEEQKKKAAILIDEAHNLVDRARDMYSASLKQTSFYSLEKLYKYKDETLYQVSRGINDYFLNMRKKVDSSGLVERDMPEDLVEKLEKFVETAESELLKEGQSDTKEELLDAYFAAQTFIRMSKLYDERYVTLSEIVNGDLHIRLFCTDPSFQLQQVSKGFRSKVFFSATLLPFQYYLDMLGKEDEDYSLALSSPFPKENVQVVIHPLSTRYKDRERTRKKITELLKETINKRPGNYLVFAPSYQYMDDLYDNFNRIKGKIETLLQDPNMAEEEREAFLNHFQPRVEGSFVGFSVLGGMFSEGIDLKGDRLNGVFVIGVGLPQIGLERDVIKTHFDKMGKNGFDYAYVFPGINKVLQAGGRLIRSETDTGQITLVDDRFLTTNYQRLLPPDWR
ncbi:ATP-dependent DNA helicase [Pullulanibacillus sp. KACC 23026]|uniref:ATP-dependent DNA helicase n=1 Tax=Pullulanibacillus sp. KACC 23026 TaxID=3028315 RepID=UPI0023AEAF93|nr:ATP-dependent DNA helicase [Pullulanibacillus sp. KACC 23026]WEG12941.1 ATP-dependent DNA helicase [Pullulanibacillus sp. KACC 23026]